ALSSAPFLPRIRGWRAGRDLGYHIEGPRNSPKCPRRRAEIVPKRHRRRVSRTHHYAQRPARRPVCFKRQGLCPSEARHVSVALVRLGPPALEGIRSSGRPISATGRAARCNPGDSAPAQRLFLECETGTHSIIATGTTKPGATLCKVERYESFLTGLADAQ